MFDLILRLAVRPQFSLPFFSLVDKSALSPGFGEFLVHATGAMALTPPLDQDGKGRRPHHEGHVALDAG
jgi:hypothetical protein